jgi:hypothetical protein
MDDTNGLEKSNEQPKITKYRIKTQEEIDLAILNKPVERPETIIEQPNLEDKRLRAIQKSKEDTIETEEQAPEKRGRGRPKGQKKVQISVKEQEKARNDKKIEKAAKGIQNTILPSKTNKEYLEIGENEIVESLEFQNGKNKLEIRLSKKDNRNYRIQFFLNNDMELRPNTYNGSAGATTFWHLLKRVLS